MTVALSQEIDKIFEKGIWLSIVYFLKTSKRPSAFNWVESTLMSLGNPIAISRVAGATNFIRNVIHFTGPFRSVVSSTNTVNFVIRRISMIRDILTEHNRLRQILHDFQKKFPIRRSVQAVIDLKLWYLIFHNFEYVPNFQHDAKRNWPHHRKTHSSYVTRARATKLVLVIRYHFQPRLEANIL